MGLYEDLTDEELAAEITAYREAIRKVELNDVGVVAGEGRRLEFTSGNLRDARDTLRNLMSERRRRGGVIGGGSIALEIG